MEVHEMEPEHAPSMHLTHEHMRKLGFPQEHMPQAGDKYGVSGVVHVESVSSHEDEKEGKTHHVHVKFHHIGMERTKEKETPAHILYPSHMGKAAHGSKGP